jgi:hypothetical protein
MADRAQVTPDVQGMTRDGCAPHVESALRGVAGVAEATVPTWQAGRATAIARAGVADEGPTASVETRRRYPGSRAAHPRRCGCPIRLAEGASRDA